MQKHTSIDLFIADFPKETQVLLQKVRETIKKAAPKAEETISYGIPTFKLNGNLVHFSGYKHHIGFYPGASGIKAFEKELSTYKGAKGSVQFPLDKPIPYALITKITKFRVKQNLGKAETKSSKKQSLKTKPLVSSDSDLVTSHIKKLEPALRKIVESIRQIILSTDKNIGEQIKWNNPCFYYTGEMNAFDPKEYKRVIAVFNLFKGRIMLVFPSGAKTKDTSGLLEGDYKDGRRIAVFKGLKDVQAKEKTLKAIVKKWLTLVGK